MPFSRATSASRAAARWPRSKPERWTVQPKAGASAIHCPYSAALTMIFFGTQPTLTQVPPQNRSSAIATVAPWVAEMRAQRTPAEPPPMTKRS